MEKNNNQKSEELGVWEKPEVITLDIELNDVEGGGGFNNDGIAGFTMS